MRHNHLIRGVYTVNLIDENGKQLGSFGLREAQRLAGDRGLDLVEVNPNSTPPTCKIMNFGQYKYEQKKKAKKPHVEIIKEAGLTVNTSEHDLGVKTRHIQEWLGEGHKVLVKIKFFGREVTHAELGFDQMNNVIGLLAPETFSVENKPVLNGKFMTMLLKPAKVNQTSANKG